MANQALVARLNEQATLLKESSQQLALLAGDLPKHGATVRGLSRALLSGSQFIQAMTVHIERDAGAA